MSGKHEADDTVEEGHFLDGPGLRKSVGEGGSRPFVMVFNREANVVINFYG